MLQKKLGVYIYANGTKYVGSWEDNEMNGNGKWFVMLQELIFI